MTESGEVDVVGAGDTVGDVGAIANILIALANAEALQTLTSEGLYWLGARLKEVSIRLQNQLSAQEQL